PEFSKIDEVLFIAGQSSANLADEKGKQKPNQYVIHEGEKKVMLTSEEFREKARGYFSQILTEHPQSSFRGQADAALKELGEPKAKTVSSKRRTIFHLLFDISHLPFEEIHLDIRLDGGLVTLRVRRAKSAIRNVRVV